MEQYFPKVWFATEKQINNRARFFNFNDRGSLKFSSGMLQFHGRKNKLIIKDIKNIDITYPQAPWISIILSIVVCMVFFGFLSDSFFGVIIFFVIFSITYLPFFILVQKLILWVEITFVDDKNVVCHAYFLDGSKLGWGGILGGTLEMYKKLRLIKSPAG